MNVRGIYQHKKTSFALGPSVVRGIYAHKNAIFELGLFPTAPPLYASITPKVFDDMLALTFLVTTRPLQSMKLAQHGCPFAGACCKFRAIWTYRKQADFTLGTAQRAYNSTVRPVKINFSIIRV